MVYGDHGLARGAPSYIVPLDPAYPVRAGQRHVSAKKKGYGNSMKLLRMRCYGDDRNHSPLRAVIPEDPVGS
jgi:hypothetical protein